jgi:hypothetical protein
MRRSFSVPLAMMFAVIALSLSAQIPPKDIADIYAEGNISGNVYKNDYFGVTLTLESGAFTKGGFQSTQGKRARLIDAASNATNRQDKFDIAILADLLAANPLIRSAQQYARSVRHQFEKEGMETIQEETPVTVSGVPFIEVVFKVKDSGPGHYRAIYAAFRNGYILSLDVSAATRDKITQLVSKGVKFM